MKMKEVTTQIEYMRKYNYGVVENFKTKEESQKSKILEYLQKAGELTGVVAGHFTDNITEKKQNDTFNFYSDGEYRWSTATIYYFDKYNIELEEEFVKKALAR